MKFTVSSDVLAQSLTKVAKAVPQKTATPILSNFLFVGNGDTLTIVGSDASITIADTINIPATGGICVPVQLLTFLKSLPECDVTIETTESALKVSYKNGSSSMPAFPAIDYPTIDITPDHEGLTIKGSSLIRGFAHTIPCISEDEIRPQLSGVYFDSEENELTMVGTDYRVLSMFPIKTDNQIGKFILPVASARVLNAICSLSDVTIAVGEKNCYFTFGSTVVSSRIVIGKYPSYKQIFPNNTCKLKASKGSFLEVFRRVSVCANKAVDTLKLNLDVLGTTVEASDMGFGVSATETPETFSYDGVAFNIGFRSQFLVKCIGFIESTDIEIAVSDPKKAAVITATDLESEPCKVLIMPVQIQQ